MAVYEDFKCYGPYTRKDGRQHVILIKHADDGSISERRTISYPKYLIEIHLGKYLESSETVDHIDEDFNNNEISNLRVVKRSIHAKSHVANVLYLDQNCIVCGSTFTPTADRKYTCCKSCAGKVSTQQDKYFDLKLDAIAKRQKCYISQRSLIEEIQSVEGANSGKLLVGNPELDESRV